MMRSVINGLRFVYSVTIQNNLCQRNLGTSSISYAQSRYKKVDREKEAVRQLEGQDAGPQDSLALPYNKTYGTSSFPTLETHSLSFDGIRFTDLPIVHVKSTRNNTIISVTDGAGTVMAIQSASSLDRGRQKARNFRRRAMGTVGFRNAKKGTNVAAQAAAIALAGDALLKDVKTVRVCLKGIGPGRLPALKALQMSGLNVISITDTTPIAHGGNRPKKARRL